MHGTYGRVRLLCVCSPENVEVFHKRHKEQEAEYRHKVHQGKETLKKTSQVCWKPFLCSSPAQQPPPPPGTGL